MLFQFVLLQTSSPNASSAFLSQMILIGGILLVFYVFMILPQQRKQKSQQKFRDNLKVGDDVITIGGIRGKIQAIENETVTLQVDKNTKITFEKYAISPEASQKLVNQNA